MATNIPPHNLTEVINGCLAMIDDPAIDLPALMEHIPGPDFPTAGIINGAAGIYSAYRTGRGRVYVRARTAIETIGTGGREAPGDTETDAATCAGHQHPLAAEVEARHSPAPVAGRPPSRSLACSRMRSRT